MPPVAELFEPVAESVGAARRYAAGAVRSYGAEPLLDDVRTVVTELATNAVLHARTPFTVSITGDGRRLRVAVSDGSPNRPRVRRHGGLEATTGRGLRMVADLSSAWGVEADGVGKTTWCDLVPAPDVDGRPDRSERPHEAAPEADADSLLAAYGDDEDPPSYASSLWSATPTGPRPGPVAA